MRLLSSVSATFVCALMVFGCDDGPHWKLNDNAGATAGVPGSPLNAESGATSTAGAAGSRARGSGRSGGSAGSSSPSGGTGGKNAGSGGGSSNTGSSSSTSGSGSEPCPPVCGPSTEQFFDNDKLATLRVTIDAAYVQQQGYAADTWLDLLWAKWLHCPPYNQVPTTMEYESPDGIGNVTMEHVGMRLRGSWERGTNALQGFKLDFQKLLGIATGPARRRFADINRLNTLSLERDPSHMVPCLAYKTLREFGTPAPFCNHLKVYVNGEYYGLMGNVEEADHGRFLAHHFGTTDGLLIEASGGCGYDDGTATLTYEGDGWADYQDPLKYKIERGTEAEAEASLFPMFECGDAAQTPDDQTFKSCIQDWLDVDEWLRVIAAESLMPALSSFMGLRNFYLYFHPDESAPHGGRWIVYSWDQDTAFHSEGCYPSDCDPMTAVAGWYGPLRSRTALVTRLTTVFKTEYCALMREFLDNVYDPSLVDDMASVIEPGMTDDPTDTQQAWQAEVTEMREFIVSHEATVRTQLSSVCN